MFYLRCEGEEYRRGRVGVQWFRGPQLCFRGRFWVLRVGLCRWRPVWWFRRWTAADEWRTKDERLRAEAERLLGDFVRRHAGEFGSPQDAPP